MSLDAFVSGVEYDLQHSCKPQTPGQYGSGKTQSRPPDYALKRVDWLLDAAWRESVFAKLSPLVDPYPISGWSACLIA